MKKSQFDGFMGDGHFVGMSGSFKIYATKHLVGRHMGGILDLRIANRR